ncbi:selenoneine biosynthesis selenosugar synthase SenB [Rubrobacter aplysinae]|uniref:selenoneine biosynthesis selenosugar synthase SenB n=1 Tax=Rubrobacter aplysinae TaxID=909625 RepID=UPI000B2C3541
MRVEIVTPKGRASGSGNWTTADRWARLLRDSGHEVSVSDSWRDEEAGLLIALHARRSHESVARFAAAHPDRPLVVALTGTDLYRDIHEDADARESLDLAWRLIVLQERGPHSLPRRHRDKTRVIYQSAPATAREPSGTRDAPDFTACVIGNLRPEKDPFRAVLAARLVPEQSRLRVLHAGGADDAHAAEARRHEGLSPRYRWLGRLGPGEARGLLARSHVLVQSSGLEGGANAVGEAMAAGLPVLASEIPGNVGMLGRGYPGYYPASDERDPASDERALARLLWRAESDAGFYAELERHVRDRAYLFEPDRERAALAALVEELSAEKLAVEAGSTTDEARYTRPMDERTRIRLTKYSTKAG